MASARSTVRLTPAGLQALLTSPAGPVYRDLLRRALAVEAEAKRRAPVDTGRLRSSITHEVRMRGGKVTARVGTTVSYARYVHWGTGVYGRRGQPIRPRRKKVLVFVPKGGTEPVFARQVKGVKPRPFLVEALLAAGRR